MAAPTGPPGPPPKAAVSGPPQLSEAAINYMNMVAPGDGPAKGPGRGVKAKANSASGRRHKVETFVSISISIKFFRLSTFHQTFP
jgi:hypothetical protein